MSGLSRRKFLRRTLAAASAGPLAGCTRNGREELYVLDWAHDIPVSTLQLFEREYGVRIRYQAYGSNQEMLRRLEEGEFPWDVAFPCQQYVDGMKSRQLLKPLDHAKIPNITGLAPRFQKPFWDHQLEYSVPVSWGCTGIAYSRQIRFEIKCWADLWDDRLRGRLTMLDDGDEILAAALLKLGHSINSANPSEIAAARDEAVAQKHLVHSYGIMESKDRLISGEFQVSHLWSSLAGQAMNAAPNLEFVFPTEGFPAFAENAVVLQSSRNPSIAHAFINFLLHPEASAHISENAYSSSTVPASRSFLPLRLREHQLLFPDEKLMERAEWFTAQPKESALVRQRAWDAIRMA